jgi:hypothetical protein
MQAEQPMPVGDRPRFESDLEAAAFQACGQWEKPRNCPPSAKL